MIASWAWVDHTLHFLLWIGVDNRDISYDQNVYGVIKSNCIDSNTIFEPLKVNKDLL